MVFDQPVAPTTSALPAPAAAAGTAAVVAVSPAKPLPRISSRHLLRHRRVIEIDHEGRIDQLRVTQLNKLILTA